jgi:hypothetical protein
VVLCESSDEGDRSSVARHVRLAAARLLWAGFSVADALDALRVLLDRRGQRPAGAVLVAFDLFVTGQLELARWGAATVRHVTADGNDSSVDTPLAVVERVDDGDWLAAVSAMSMSTAPAGVFAELPRRLERATDPCQVRDSMVHSWLAEAGSAPGQEPPLVIANRVESRLAWSRH